QRAASLDSDDTKALAWEWAIRARLAVIVVADSLHAAVVSGAAIRRQGWHRSQVRNRDDGSHRCRRDQPAKVGGSDQAHCYLLLGDSLSSRLQRLTLAFEALSIGLVFPRVASCARRPIGAPKTG